MEEFIYTVVYSNALPLILSFIFLAIIIYNPIFDKKQSRLFFLANCVCIYMIINISMDFYFSLIDGSSFVNMRRITSFFNFVASPIIPLLLYKISNINKSTKWLYLPLMVNIILCLISIPTGIIFYIDSFNHYTRGFLFFAPFFFTILYTIILIIDSQYKYLKSRYSERIFLFVTILLLFVAIATEMLFSFHFLLWTTASISLPLYYLILNINQSILDPLTATYNRIMYTKDINKLNHRLNCVIALLDINEFKYINDTYGHEAGDLALINFSKIMGHIPMNASLYRIGGDEFVIIFKKSNDIQKAIDYLNQKRIEVNHHDIDFSYGIDIYNVSEDIYEFLNHIDSLMYENKKKDKQEKKDK